MSHCDVTQITAGKSVKMLISLVSAATFKEGSLKLCVVSAVMLYLINQVYGHR